MENAFNWLQTQLPKQGETYGDITLEETYFFTYPGLSDPEINELCNRLPGWTLPESLRDIYLHSNGFEFRVITNEGIKSISLVPLEEFIIWESENWEINMLRHAFMKNDQYFSEAEISQIRSGESPASYPRVFMTLDSLSIEWVLLQTSVTPEPLVFMNHEGDYFHRGTFEEFMIRYWKHNGSENFYTRMM